MPNYFNEEYILPRATEYKIADHNRREELLNEMYTQIYKLINGIIFTHRFQVYENVDELQSIALEAIIKSLETFNPNYITSKNQKVTIFNFMSLTAKRACQYHTIREKNNRENVKLSSLVNPDNYIQPVEDPINTNIELHDLELNLNNILTPQLKPSQRGITNVLIKYLKQRGSFARRDFFRYAQFYGFSSYQIRQFLKKLKLNRNEFY